MFVSLMDQRSRENNVLLHTYYMVL
jgi:hypothetical protein